MFYKWLRIKIVVTEVFDVPTKCGADRLSNLIYNKIDDNDLAETFDHVAHCHGEDEFQRAADRWHQALFRWLDREYGEKAINIERQIDQILSGDRVQIV